MNSKLKTNGALLVGPVVPNLNLATLAKLQQRKKRVLHHRVENTSTGL